MSDNSEEGWTKIAHKKPHSDKPKTPRVEQPPQEEEVNEWNKVTVLRKKNTLKPTVKQPNISRPNAKFKTEKGVFHKLDNADSADTLNKVKLSTGQMIQQERARQGLSQADLVKKVGGKAKLTLHDLQQLEKGTALQSNMNGKITAIENALNYRVRGKMTGQPMRKANVTKK